MPLGRKANNATTRDGKESLVVTAKETTEGNSSENANGRTVSGENPAPQIKIKRDGSENYGIVHLHCLNDNEKSEKVEGKALG